MKEIEFLNKLKEIIDESDTKGQMICAIEMRILELQGDL